MESALRQQTMFKAGRGVAGEAANATTSLVRQGGKGACQTGGRRMETTRIGLTLRNLKICAPLTRANEGRRWTSEDRPRPAPPHFACRVFGVMCVCVCALALTDFCTCVCDGVYYDSMSLLMLVGRYNTSARKQEQIRNHALHVQNICETYRVHHT